MQPEESKDSKSGDCPPYTPSAPPPSGYRITVLSSSSPFPDPSHTKLPVCYDWGDPDCPVYLGSAIFDRSVHPCKISPSRNPSCRVPYGGNEIKHDGRFDLLPFDPKTMEWVPTSLGRNPAHRRPVWGGREENGEILYHAIATVEGVRVPGKVGVHLVSIYLDDDPPLNVRYSRVGVTWPTAGKSMPPLTSTVFCKSSFISPFVCLAQRNILDRCWKREYDSEALIPSEGWPGT